jgi:hypothetical protein
MSFDDGPPRMMATFQLHSEIAAIIRDQLGRQLSDLQGDVRSVADDLDSLRKDVRKLTEEIRAQAGRAAAMAERNRLEAEMQRQFEPRRSTRRLAINLMDDLCAAAIHNQVIDPDVLRRYASERLIENTDYWLAPAVVAVAADYAGDEELRLRALGLAHAKDRNKTDLFLALVYPQLGRSTGAVSSRRSVYLEAGSLHMSLYLGSVDPLTLGREFFSVLDALAQHELGDDARSYARETLARWDAEIEPSPEIYSQQFDACTTHLLGHRGAIPAGDYPTLREFTGDGWTDIENAWSYASACQGAAAYFRDRFATPAVESGTEPFHTRRALRTLVDTLEPDELVFQSRIHAEQLVLDADVERASALRQADDSYAATIDFPSLLTLAAFSPAESGIGPQAQRFALACASGWIMTAGASVTKHALAARPTRVTLQRGLWQGSIDLEATDPAQAERVANGLCDQLRQLTPLPRGHLRQLIGITATLMLVSWLVFDAFGPPLALLALGAVAAGVERKAIKDAREAREREVAAAQQLARTQVHECRREGAALVDRWTSSTEHGIAALKESLSQLYA